MASLSLQGCLKQLGGPLETPSRIFSVSSCGLSYTTDPLPPVSSLDPSFFATHLPTSSWRLETKIS